MANVETAPILGCGFFDIHAADLGPAGSFPEKAFEFGKLLGAAMGVHFHAAVIEVAHPSVNPYGVGGMYNEVTITDTLDASTNDVPPSDTLGHGSYGNSGPRKCARPVTVLSGN
jgi:hypothetical protein